MATKPTQVPRIATTAGRVVEPPENGTTTTTKDYGFKEGTRPPARMMNWWLNLIYLWVLYLQDLEAQVMNWTNHHTFSTASGVSVAIDGGDPTAAVLTVTNNDDGAGGAFYAGPGSVALYGQGGTGAPGILGASAGGNTPAIQGVGSGTGAGVYGIGGATGPGLKGQGSGTGPGVWGIAGAGGSQGGLFSGSGSSQGVACVGGPTSGIGIVAAAGGGNAPGAQVTGSGSGAGITATGGATGTGGVFSGGATQGTGVQGSGVGGFTGGVFTGGAGGAGVLAIGGTNAAGIDARGSSTGNTVGVLAQGHGSGGGIVSTGGTSSGPGVQGIAGTGNGNGVEGTGTGTGAGVKGTAGTTTGAGVQAIGSGTGTAGPAVLATASHGEADCAIQVTKGTLRFTGTPPAPNVDLGANAANGASLVKSTGMLTIHLGTGSGDETVTFLGNGHNYESCQIELDHKTISVFFATPMADGHFHVSVVARWAGNPPNLMWIPIPLDPAIMTQPVTDCFQFGIAQLAGSGVSFIGLDTNGFGFNDIVVTWEVTGRQ